MPVQPPSKGTGEMEAEGDSATEMNGEEEESEEERSGSQTESEEESSEMDDEDYERRRSECVSEMLDLEKQFSELKEKLFRERLSQLRLRLEEVGAERAPEYTEPLGGLQQSLKIRIQVAGIYKGFCLDVIRNKYECELQGAKQHLESEKLLLYDTLQGELQERIQRLEEDRQSLDLSSEWWDDKLHARGSSRSWDSLPPSKRKKAPLVSGPYIVYMLQEIDILEDWTAIKKVGPLLSMCPAPPQAPHPGSSSAICRPGSSLLTKAPPSSAQGPWIAVGSQVLLLKAALGEGISSLCQPLPVPGQVLMGWEGGGEAGEPLSWPAVRSMGALAWGDLCSQPWGHSTKAAAHTPQRCGVGQGLPSCRWALRGAFLLIHPG
ncbi:breast cancer metastasis-suppressor 1 isoform X2 [Piliocolobus tephrosceles]|nr:breast cancer metastasis-suppressor 1 isoform X2 [Piliocolobus tephrosceles]